MADQETGKDAGSCATTIADVEEVDEMTMLIRAKNFKTGKYQT